MILKMSIFLLLLILVIIIIIATIVVIILRPNIIPTKNKVDSVPTTLEGNSDGSWFEVKDQNGNVVFDVGNKGEMDINVTCPKGISLIGFGENSLGPIICNGDENKQEKASRYYGFSGNCPAGYYKDSLGSTTRFICIPDVECSFQTDCAPGFVCNNNMCEPIEDF